MYGPPGSRPWEAFSLVEVHLESGGLVVPEMGRKQGCCNGNGSEASHHPKNSHSHRPSDSHSSQ
jgi:hypothetical protein